MIMEHAKPYEKIALQYHISKESAKYFLGRVQKSFKTERPPHKLIVNFMEIQGVEFLLTPYEIATMMNESGVWSHTLINEPPPVADDNDLSL